MKRTRAPEEQQQQQSPENNNNGISGENNEGVQKKPKIDFTERISQIASALCRHIEDHDNSMDKARNKIEEVCNALREAVDVLEDRLRNTVEKWYLKENSRLDESLEKLKDLNNAQEEEDGMSDDEKEKRLKEIEYTLYGVQRYEVKMPECDDLKEWASNTLSSEFKVNVHQSLSEELLRERAFRITGVNEVNPNEVHIVASFLEAEEEAAMKQMELWSGVDYVVEMWNGEEGEDYEVRTEQVIGPSHNAYVEWRFIGGDECKVRGRATWRGLSGEECQSEWSEWRSFSVSREHRNSGSDILMTCVAWKKREVGESYTVIDTITGKVLYRGMKPYTRIPRSSRGHELLIRGEKERRRWEERRTVDIVPKDLENLLNDLRIFHTDDDACGNALYRLVKLARCKYHFNGQQMHTSCSHNHIYIPFFCTASSETRTLIGNLNWIDVISNTLRNRMDNDYACGRGLAAIGNIICGNPDNQKLAVESGCIELARDAIKNHMDNTNVCENGLYAIGNITCGNTDNKRLAGELGCIEVVRDAIRKHMDNADVCGNGLNAIGNIAYNNPDNKRLAGELGCIEVVRDAIRKHMDSDVACEFGLDAIESIICDNPDNQRLAVESGCIELIKDVVKKYVGNAGVCQNGFAAIGNIVFGNPDNQKAACELGFVDLVFEIIDHYKEKMNIAEWCCVYLVRFLSSKDTHTKWCTEDVLKKVEECQARFEDSLLIRKCLACLKREEDPRVADAVERCVCTKETTSCGEEDCPRKKNNCFCDECATPQKCFQCFECQGSPVCCEVCMKGKHSGHQGAEFFDIITCC